MVSENPPRDPSIQESTNSSERKRLINLPRSVIPACDVGDLDTFERLVRETTDVEGIGGYKIGFELVFPYGAIEVVRRAKEHTSLPIIYDHQKGGTDIPDMGPKFVSALKKAGVDSAILFPLAGTKTQRKWTEALQAAEGMTIFVGGEMTHDEFLRKDGGYIADDSPERIYTLAAEMGVTHFIVPGNKPESVAKYRQLLEGILGEGNFDLAAPGLITQGGDISEAGKAAGEFFHGIVGRALTEAQDIRQAALQAVSKLK